MTKLNFFLLLFLLSFSANGSTISGTVTGDGSPLQGATIHAQDTNTSIEVTTQTDINGDYTIQLSAGTYEVWADAPTNTNYGTSPIDSIVLGTNPVAYNIAFISPPNPTYNVSGNVLDQNGSPISNDGGWMRLEGSNSNNNYNIAINPDGSYSGDVEPDTYGVGILFQEPIPYFSYHNEEQGQITVPSQNVVQDYVIPMNTLVVNVVDSNGFHIANSSVDIETESHIFVNEGTTDASGQVSLRTFADNNYKVTVSPPINSGLVFAHVNSVDVTSDQSIQVVLQPQAPRFNVSGNVLDQNGSPISNDGGWMRLEGSNSNNNYNIAINPDGSYSGDVEPDTYGVGILFQEPIPYFSYHNEEQGQITVPSQNVVQDYVIPMNTLVVNVVDSNGFHIANSSVDIETESHIFVNEGTTDASGQVSLRAFADNNYRVTVSPPINSGLVFAHVNSVDVTSDQSIQVVLQPQAPRFNVSGNVLDQNGSPISNDGGWMRLEGSNSNNNYNIAINPDGSYSGDVEPDTYGVGILFQEPIPYFSYHNEEQGQITVPSQNVVQDYVIPMNTLVVNVVDSNGFHIANSSVDIETESHIFVNEGTTDASGQVSLRTFADNNYKVTVSPPINSGFDSQSTNGNDFSNDSFFTAVLVLPDISAPTLLSGPHITDVSQSSATVEWQTDEPAASIVNINGTTYSNGSNDYSTLHNILVDNLQINTEYSFVVESEDQSGNTLVSNTDNFRTNDVQDIHSPVLTFGPQAHSINHDQVIIDWETNEATHGIVMYREEGTNTWLTINDNSLESNHEVVVPGLSSSTRYEFQVSSSDAHLNSQTLSQVKTFETTQNPESNPPVIVSGPVLVNLTHDSVAIEWKTNEPATSGVSYNDGVSHGVYQSDHLVTNHLVTLKGLEASTLYNFGVSSTDGNGNGPVLSQMDSFTTQSQSNPGVLDFVGLPKVIGVTTDSVIIQVRTTLPADSLLTFGSNANSLNDGVPKTDLQTSQLIHLNSLNPGETYYYQVQSSSPSGDQIQTSILSFETLRQPKVQPPLFTDEPKVVGQDQDKSVISWKTDVPTRYVINSQSNGQVQRVDHGHFDREHTFVLSDPGLNAVVDVEVDDVNGNHSTYNLSTAAGLSTPQTQATIPIVDYLSSDKAVFSWATASPGDSRLVLKPCEACAENHYGSVDITKDHQAMVSGLSPGTAYDVYIRSNDVNGAELVNQQIQFTTELQADKTKPVITAVLIEEVLGYGSKVSWSTDELSTGEVRIHTADGVIQLGHMDVSREHEVYVWVDSNLISFIEITSIDLSGNKQDTYIGEDAPIFRDGFDN